MPFIGMLEGEAVAPERVEDDATIACRLCDEPMRVVSSYWRNEPDGSQTFVARHFRHQNQRECEGESDEHVRMKSVLLSFFLDTLGDRIVESGMDDRIFGERQPDVYLIFEQPDDTLGKGLFLEAQYRHESKDIESVTADYHEMGYSVVWANEDHFDGRTLATIPMPIPVWPNAMPNPLWDSLELTDWDDHDTWDCWMLLERLIGTFEEDAERGFEVTIPPDYFLTPEFEETIEAAHREGISEYRRKQRAEEEGRSDNTLVEKVVRVVEYQTSSNQSNTISMWNVRQICSSNKHRPAAVQGALDKAVEDGLLEQDGEGRERRYAIK